MRITNETKVGIFTVFALAILIFGYTYMQGIALFSPTNHYYAIYDEVDGLKPSNPVLLNGYQVGRVTKIKLQPSAHEFKILVKFSVQGDIKIPRNSTAMIVNYDLLGAKAIDLQFSPETEIAENNDTLRAERELGISESFNQLLAPVKQRTENLITSVDTVVLALHNIIKAAEIEFIFNSVQNALKSLERTSHRLDTMVHEEADRVDRIFTNIESITGNFRDHNEELGNIFTNFSALSDSLVAADIKHTLTTTANTLNEIDQIVTRLNKGDGTAGKLLTDDELYFRLNDVTQSMERLTRNIMEQPRRYLNLSIFNRRRPEPLKEQEPDDNEAYEERKSDQ